MIPIRAHPPPQPTSNSAARAGAGGCCNCRPCCCLSAALISVMLRCVRTSNPPPDPPRRPARTLPMFWVLCGMQQQRVGPSGRLGQHIQAGGLATSGTAHVCTCMCMCACACAWGWGVHARAASYPLLPPSYLPAAKRLRKTSKVAETTTPCFLRLASPSAPRRPQATASAQTQPSRAGQAPQNPPSAGVASTMHSHAAGGAGGSQPAPSPASTRTVSASTPNASFSANSAASAGGTPSAPAGLHFARPESVVPGRRGAPPATTPGTSAASSRVPAPDFHFDPPTTTTVNTPHGNVQVDILPVPASMFPGNANLGAVPEQFRNMATQLAAQLSQNLMRDPQMDPAAFIQQLQQTLPAGAAMFGFGMPMPEEQGPPPCTPEFLASLSEQELTQRMIDTHGNEQCAVCIVKQDAGDKAIVLECGHGFHKDCIWPWLTAHSTCPVCRHSLRDPSTVNAGAGASAAAGATPNLFRMDMSQPPQNPAPATRATPNPIAGAAPASQTTGTHAATGGQHHAANHAAGHGAHVPGLAQPANAQGQFPLDIMQLIQNALSGAGAGGGLPPGVTIHTATIPLTFPRHAPQQGGQPAQPPAPANPTSTATTSHATAQPGPAHQHTAPGPDASPRVAAGGAANSTSTSAVAGHEGSRATPAAAATPLTTSAPADPLSSPPENTAPYALPHGHAHTHASHAQTDTPNVGTATATATTSNAGDHAGASQAQTGPDTNPANAGRHAEDMPNPMSDPTGFASFIQTQLMQGFSGMPAGAGATFHAQHEHAHANVHAQAHARAQAQTAGHTGASPNAQQPQGAHSGGAHTTPQSASASGTGETRAAPRRAGASAAPNSRGSNPPAATTSAPPTSSHTSASQQQQQQQPDPFSDPAGFAAFIQNQMMNGAIPGMGGAQFHMPAGATSPTGSNTESHTGGAHSFSQSGPGMGGSFSFSFSTGPPDATFSHSHTTGSSQSGTAAAPTPHSTHTQASTTQPDVPTRREDLAQLSVRELKRKLDAFGLSYRGAVEKSDLVDLLFDAVTKA